MPLVLLTYMAGSRTRIRRKQVDAVVCAGHQELRDIVIETRNDVRHIREALDDGSDKMKDHERRIDALESAEDQRKGFDKHVRAIATARATIVSILISAAGLVIAFIALFWPHRGP